MRIDAVIPFFAGTSAATHSSEDTRLDYLQQTLDSLAAYDITSHVFVTKRDRGLADLILSVQPMVLDIQPEWLPWAACTYWQKEGARGDLVYVTEADQVLWVADTDVFSIPNDSRYLAPWRLDLVGPNGECEMPEGAKYVTRTGRQYSISNGAHRLVAHDVDKLGPYTVIPQHAQQQAFSGAYFATPEFFSRIKFRKRRVLPVEHATGFDAKAIGLCVKTSDVERLWVDHLSPRDRHQPPKEVNE